MVLIVYVVMNMILAGLHVMMFLLSLPLSPSSLLFLLLFVPAADLPAPLPPAAGSAAAEAQLQRQQVLSSQRQVSLTPPPPPPPSSFYSV